MNKRKRVGLDFDDVLVDFNGGMALYHNERYGSSYTREQVTTWNYEELWGCSKEEAMRRMREFVVSEHHELILPIPGAIEAIKQLQETCDLYIVTARDEVISDQTFFLARQHFPDSFKEVHFLHRDDQNVRGTKGDVCLELGIEVLVEDALANALHVSNAGVKTLLFDTPWNQTDTLPDKVTRVYSWEHILEEISK